MGKTRIAKAMFRAMQYDLLQRQILSDLERDSRSPSTGTSTTDTSAQTPTPDPKMNLADDFRIKISLENNMFDESLYHVALLYPEHTKQDFKFCRPMHRMKRELSFAPAIIQHRPPVRTQRYYLIENPNGQSPARSSESNRQFASACLKCHQLKQKCIRDGYPPQKCRGCTRRGIECKIRLDCRSHRYKRHKA